MPLALPENGRPAAPWMACFATEMLLRYPDMRPLDAIRHAAQAHRSYGRLDAAQALRLHLMAGRLADRAQLPGTQGAVS